MEGIPAMLESPRWSATAKKTSKRDKNVCAVWAIVENPSYPGVSLWMDFGPTVRMNSTLLIIAK